jgi:hypothetical protein
MQAKARGQLDISSIARRPAPIVIPRRSKMAKEREPQLVPRGRRS